MKIRITGVNATSKKLSDAVSAAQDKILKRKLVQLKDKLAAATPVDTGEAANGWRVEGNKLINDVPHIAQLNHGTSDQAPSYFVEATLLSDANVKPAGLIVDYKED